MTEWHQQKGWKATVARVRPHMAALVASGQARCIDCGRVIDPSDRWAIGHVVSVVQARAAGWPDEQINSPDNLGPTHHGKGKGKACNQSAGAKLSHQTRRANQQERDGYPRW